MMNYYTKSCHMRISYLCIDPIEYWNIEYEKKYLNVIK